MIPHLPLSYDAAPVVRVPPPPKFRGAENVVWARLGPPRPTTSAPRRAASSQAARVGLRYEDRIQQWLVAELGSSYLPSPWIEYEDRKGRGRCQPDGLLITPSSVVVFEIKIRHMPEAWWQLRKLYEPVVTALYKRPIKLIEVVSSFDPAMPFPEPIEMIEDLVGETPQGIGVLIRKV